MSKSAYSRLQFESDLTGNATTLLVRLVTKMCEDVRSPYALKILILLRQKDYDNLLHFSYVNPNHYCSPDAYVKDVSISAAIRKYPAWPITGNPVQACVDKFLECEESCARTNRNFSGGLQFRNPIVSSILHSTQRKIRKVLGNAPTISSLDFGFGPGNALNVSNYTSAFHKLKSTLDVTASCYGYATELLYSCPGWLKCFSISHEDSPDLFDLINVVPGSRLSSVPKTALTDRPICIEPLLNGVIQKGIGGAIRRRLRYANWVNLPKAQQRHRFLARQASISDDLSTVDLSSASDTISHAVVAHLLPSDWFELLDNSRSTHYTVGSRKLEFQKFSSMGNGFTFELESLLFLAIARSVCEYLNLPEHLCSCYGDDIIIPSSAYDTLQLVLDYCGFSVNHEKSFHKGPFRESCGGDFYNGTAVRPFFLKTSLSPRTITLWVNYLRREGHQYYFPSLYMNLTKLLREVGFWNVGPDIGTDGHVIDYFFPVGREYITYENRPKARKHSHPTMLGAFALYRQMQVSSLVVSDEAINMYYGIERYGGFTRSNAENYKRKRRPHWGLLPG